MKLTYILLAVVGLALTACGPTGGTSSVPGGTQVYKITSRDANQIPFRVLDSVNSLRAAAGAPPVQLNQQLTRAASSHSRDMSVQNRPWHFGSDGSSPLDRVARAGYSGALLGENISETYETELQTLEAWMQQPDTRDVILDPRARNLGVAWYQEKGGKLWWTLITGA